MSNTVSIPNKLYKDNKLKDFDVRIYMHIVNHVNDDGYTWVTNDTLAYLTAKKETAVKDAINSLVKHNYLFKKLNAKQNDIYAIDYKRVIWLMPSYRDYQGMKRQNKVQELKKSIDTDFNLFVAWLKTDCSYINIPVSVGGLVQNYMIEKGNNNKYYLYVYPSGDGKQEVDKFDSLNVYKVMFAKRKAIFKFMRTREESLSLQELTKIANERADD